MITKKYLGVSAAVVAAFALAAPSLGQEVSGTLTGMFDSNYKSTLDEIIAKFEERYPDVKVEFNYQGGDVLGLASTQVQSQTAPDILITLPGGDANNSAGVNVVTLAYQGRLLDLSEGAWTKEIPAVWAPDVSFDGKVYAYPGAIQSLAAVFNKDTLDKYGLKAPTTLDEVLKLCEDAKAAGIYAYAAGLGEVTAGPQMLSFAQVATLVYGPDPDFHLKLRDGTVKYQDSGWVTQFEIYQQMFNAGCFGEGSLGMSRQQASEAVAAGLALGNVDVGAAKAIIQGLAPEASLIVTGMPATNDGKTFVTALPGYTVSVNATAKNPEAAKAFLAFLAEPESSVIFANGFASVPIIPNASYSAPADLADFAALVASGQYAKLANLGGPSVQQALNDGVQSMLLGNDTPVGVAEKMQAAYDSMN